MAIEEFGKLIVLKKCYEMVPTTENTHSAPKSIFGKGKGHREKYNASIQELPEACLQYCQFDVLAGDFLRYKIVSSPLIVASLPLNIIVVNVLGSFVLFQIKPEIEREPTNCQCMSTGTISHSKCRYCK